MGISNPGFAQNNPQSNGVDAIQGFTVVNDVFLQKSFEFESELSSESACESSVRCASRVVKTVELLERLQIHSKVLFLGCLLGDGNMKLKDRHTQKEITFKRFHVAHVLKREAGFGIATLSVIDPQFSNGPIALDQYLNLIKKSQPLQDQPDLQYRTCYWSLIKSEDVEGSIKALVH